MPLKQAQNKSADASKAAVKQITAPTQVTNRLSATAKVNVPTKKKLAKATVTKITKLVLKPKPAAPKSSLTSKVTTKKYTVKPVTIESRSTKISHESTFRIQSIQKTPPKQQRQSAENVLISIENKEISGTFIVNRTLSDVNSARAPNKTFEQIEANEQQTNITSLNVTQIMDGPILKEITSAVDNSSNVMNNSENPFDRNALKNVKGNLQSPKKHCENDTECKSKSYDPIKARQFIRMQKEKRKQDEEAKAKLPVTKDEIKQRLSALRQNTMKIMEKNVQKARKTDIKSTKSRIFTPRTASETSKPVAGKE